jgi:hypothetical protein
MNRGGGNKERKRNRKSASGLEDVEKQGGGEYTVQACRSQAMRTWGALLS